MRTLFYHSAPNWTGSSRAFAVAARGLAARGDTVSVVVPIDSPVEQSFSRDGLDVITMPITNSVSRDAWRLRALLRERFVEVVFLHGEREQLVASTAMRLAERGAVIRRVPSGATVAPARSARVATRITASRLLFSTDADRQRAAMPDAFLAPLGVDVQRSDDERAASRTMLGVEHGTQLMVCVADRRSKPRITTALRTAALLAERHPGLRIALVGSGCDDDDTHMHASALGVTHLIRFLGERDDLSSVLAAADVGWVAAESDDGAYACLDFMAAAVPVIAERSPYISQYVPDGIAGVLLPPADPSDTAAAVASFLTDENQRAAMGRAGRTRVARDFTEAATVDGFAAAAQAAGDRTHWAAR
jgi:glycosyltransferase involved in cell wall biosynthesis